MSSLNPLSVHDPNEIGTSDDQYPRSGSSPGLPVALGFATAPDFAGGGRGTQAGFTFVVTGVAGFGFVAPGAVLVTTGVVVAMVAVAVGVPTAAATTVVVESTVGCGLAAGVIGSVRGLSELAAGFFDWKPPIRVEASTPPPTRSANATPTMRPTGFFRCSTYDSRASLVDATDEATDEEPATGMAGSVVTPADGIELELPGGLDDPTIAFTPDDGTNLGTLAGRGIGVSLKSDGDGGNVLVTRTLGSICPAP